MPLKIDHEKCMQCGGCVSICPVDALELHSDLKCDNKKCTECRLCVRFCPVKALSI